MKDAINSTYGFGCHCRNCQFKVEHKLANDETMMRCINGVLRPDQMNNWSFCSAGKLLVEDEKVVSAIRSMRNEVDMNMANYASVKLTLKNSKTMYVTLDPNDKSKIRFYGIDKCDAPEKLQESMINNHDPHYTILEKDFIIALGDCVETVSINSWKY